MPGHTSWPSDAGFRGGSRCTCKDAEGTRAQPNGSAPAGRRHPSGRQVHARARARGAMEQHTKAGLCEPSGVAAQPAAGPRQSVRDHVTWGGAKTPSVTHGVVRRGSGRALCNKACPSLTPFSTCDERAAARGARRAWRQRVIEHREVVHDVPGQVPSRFGRLHGAAQALRIAVCNRLQGGFSSHWYVSPGQPSAR